MLKHNEVNPLNCLDARRVEILPPHFHKYNYSYVLSEEDDNIYNTPSESMVDIIRWIMNNCSGRFFITEVDKDGGFLDISDENSLYAILHPHWKHHYLIGFELESDMTWFALNGNTIYQSTSLVVS